MALARDFIAHHLEQSYVGVGVAVNTDKFFVSFELLTGYKPYPWQIRLFQALAAGEIPHNLSLPTGTGKTSIIPVWISAIWHQLANGLPLTVPRRLYFSIDRRVVVDQSEVIAKEIHQRVQQNQELHDLLKSRVALSEPLVVSVLRGQRVTEQEPIIKDPSAFAIVLCTPDMVFSRLLWHAYAASPRLASREAGLVGQDAYIVLDEAHLSDAARRVLETVVLHNQCIKPFWYTCMSATLRNSDGAFTLSEDDLTALGPKLKAPKFARILDVPEAGVFDTVSELLTSHPDWKRAIIYVTKPTAATRLHKQLKHTYTTTLLTGTMRGYERSKIDFSAFQHGAAPTNERHVLICTSAGEVGLDLSSDVMITEIASAERLQQRLGRLNRWNETLGHAYILNLQNDKTERAAELDATLAYLQSLPPEGDGFDVSTLSFYQHPIPATAFMPAPASLSIDKAALIALSSNFGAVPVDKYIRGSDFEYHVNLVIRKDAEINALLHMEQTALREYSAAAPVLNNEVFKEAINKKVKTELASIAKNFVWVGAGEDATVISADELKKMYLSGGTLYLHESANCINNLGTFEIGGDGIGDVFSLLQNRTQRFVKATGGFRSIETDEIIEARTPNELVKKLPVPDGYKAKIIFGQGGLFYVRAVKKQKRTIMTLAEHMDAAKNVGQMLVQTLGLAAELAAAIVTAMQHHDDGKAHWLWQLAARGTSDGEPLAKIGGAFHNPLLLGGMRHELVSVLDNGLGDLEKWLIASHHGRCRTVFEKQAYDPDRLAESDALNQQLPFVLESLQRHHGLWGLSYLEAVVRAADINAENELDA